MLTSTVEEFFHDKFIARNKLGKTDLVLAIDGPDFDPILMGHKDKVASGNKFRFFYLQRNQNHRPYYRVIECRHTESKGDAICGATFTDLFKFYDHMRAHLKEKVYQCQLCEFAFSQRGNLNRHMRIKHPLA